MRYVFIKIFGLFWVKLANDLVSSLYHFLSAKNYPKQAGTSPSRRHIQGSKIAKRLPSVKYSFTEVENRKFFEKITY